MFILKHKNKMLRTNLQMPTWRPCQFQFHTEMAKKKGECGQNPRRVAVLAGHGNVYELRWYNVSQSAWEREINLRNDCNSFVSFSPDLHKAVGQKIPPNF